MMEAFDRVTFEELSYKWLYKRSINHHSRLYRFVLSGCTTVISHKVANNLSISQNYNAINRHNHRPTHCKKGTWRLERERERAQEQYKQSNQLSPPQQDVCQTRKNKDRNKQVKKPSHTVDATTNKERIILEFQYNMKSCRGITHWVSKVYTYTPYIVLKLLNAIRMAFHWEG